MAVVRLTGNKGYASHDGTNDRLVLGREIPIVIRFVRHIVGIIPWVDSFCEVSIRRYNHGVLCCRERLGTDTSSPTKGQFKNTTT